MTNLANGNLMTQDAVIILTVSTGILSATVTMVIEAYRASRTLARSQKAAETAVFNQTIATGDLDKIGDYLKHKLGSVDAAVYARDAEVQGRVDLSIAKITAIVSQPAPSVDQVAPVVPAAAIPWPQRHPPSFSTDAGWRHSILGENEALRDAMREFDAGKNWNALFGVRRDLEMKIGAPRTGGPLTPPPNFIGSKEGLLAHREFLRVANRAIHGEPVTDDETIQALQAAKIVYDSLQSNNGPGVGV